MQELKSLIVLVTLVTVISTVLICIVPQGKMRSAFKVLCALVVIYAIMSAFSSFSFDNLDFDSFFETDEMSESFMEEANEAALLAGEEGYSKAAYEVLSKNGLSPKKIQAKCLIKNDEIILKSLTVHGNFDSEEKEKANKALIEIINEETVINYINGE